MFFNNPIGLVVDKSRLEFASLKDFYLYIFDMLYQQFPKGYIDYKVFLYDNTMLRGSPLGECCRYIERSWEESESFCIKVNWSLPIKTRDKLTDLMRKMTRCITGSYLDLYEFDKAWNTFYKSIDNEWQPP